ncbi:MAG: hypothetical protein KAT34_22285 [Candidatus Aminicenantes bacterium]|nr:hypothetical protein [Candidatus Aminicenantes bacterium]
MDVREIEGKDQFKKTLPAFIVTSGFKLIEKIAVIRDADNNANDAFKSVTGVLEKNDLKPPKKPGEFSNGAPSVGVFVMPDNTSKGMLEDLCLGTVRDHPAIKCVDTFITCVQSLRETPKNISKARVQAYLAAKPTIAQSLGVGAQKGHWDLKSENLHPLISFLKQLK